MELTTLNTYLPFIFLGIGSVSIAIAIFFKSSKSSLKETGIEVEGIIFKQERNTNFSIQIDDSSSSINNRITVRFVTKKQEWITEVIKQDFQLFYTGQYKDGNTIKIFYDESNPSNFFVDTKQSEFIVRIMFSIVGLVFISIGLYKIIFNGGGE